MTVDYPALVRDTADVLVIVDAGVYSYVSPACARTLGWDAGELEGHREEEFIHRDDLGELAAGREALQNSGSATTCYRLRRRDGTHVWAEVRSRRAGARDSALTVSSIRDVTESHELTAILRGQALSDPLTGVANRPVLMDRLQQGLRRLARGDGVLALLYVDLDRFKVINDSLGHRIGDAVLLQMAERLGRHLRREDTLARLGGDEFVILAEGLDDEAAALALAERVIASGREPFGLGVEEYTCTLSVGVATTSDADRSADDLLQEADLALYRAKDRGRDRAELFDEDLRTRAVGRLGTERLLRRALDEGHVVVQYQPIVELATGRTVACEALVRIRDGEGELLRPAAFIDVAAETGLLIAIDEQVLADAVAQASGWRARFPTCGLDNVAINVTARHLADARFTTGVLLQLDSLQVPHATLHVELTERVLMEASNSAMSGLRMLREAGVRVGLDDFGTGYSSLAYLHGFPLDFVKIDRSSIESVDHHGRRRAVVAAIIQLAHALELTVIAEGVETLAELRVLEDLGCDRAQGFVFAAPAGPRAIDHLVRAGPDARRG